MIRLRLATWAALAGVTLAAGCASPCNSCGGGFQRMSLFRARGAVACPCETCGGGGGCGGGPVAGTLVSDGPLLGEPPGAVVHPGAAPFAAPFAGVPSAPSPLPPNLGAPFGTPSVPVPDAGRLTPIPIPNAAQPVPAEGSSRTRR